MTIDKIKGYKYNRNRGVSDEKAYLSGTRPLAVVFTVVVATQPIEHQVFYALIESVGERSDLS